MSQKTRAKCPHCHALLSIERPNEPRVAPCPRCNGEIRVPQDIVPEQSTLQPRAADSMPAESKASPSVLKSSMHNGVKLAGVIAGVVAVLYVVVVRGNGSELTDAMQKAHEINTMERAALRERDMEDLHARKARLLSEIESLREKIDRADDAIRALLNQTDLNTSEVESAFEGEKS